ncbi:hypothetical protein LBMAG35_10830 [Chlorobiota bacterium]|nr:hypothetical protein LBMAG35_10830 [Chlorobiota bacterium]
MRITSVAEPAFANTKADVPRMMPSMELTCAMQKPCLYSSAADFSSIPSELAMLNSGLIASFQYRAPLFNDAGFSISSSPSGVNPLFCDPPGTPTEEYDSMNPA